MSVYPAALPTVRPAVRSAFEQGSGGGAASIIAGLFAQGQQGFWLPFTDFASLTQDSAGTLPYTALEQPVGRVLDRSGRGNHASQHTSTARGVVSARVNVFTETEFRGAGVDIGVSYTFGTLDGYVGALRFTNTPGNTYAYKLGGAGGGLICIFSFVVKMDDGSVPLTASNSAADDFRIVLNNAVCSVVETSGLGGGLYRLKTAPVLINAALNIGVMKYSTNSAKPFTVTAYSLVPVAQSSLPYQRVNTSTDYDAVGFPKFLRVEVDDFYTCNGGGSTTGFYYSDVIRPMQFGPSYKTLFYNGNPVTRQGYFVSLTTSGQLEFAAGNGTINTAIASPVLTLGEAAHICCWDDMVNMYLQVNGGTIYSVPRPAVVSGGATINLFSTSTTQNFNGQITEPIYRAGPPPNAYERSVIRGYQMQKAGL